MCATFGNLADVLDGRADDRTASGEETGEEIVAINGGVDGESGEGDTRLGVGDEIVLRERFKLRNEGMLGLDSITLVVG